MFARNRFELLNIMIMIVLVAVTLIPFLYLLMISFLSPEEYYAHGIRFPRQFSLFNYKVLLSGRSVILQAFSVTIFITAVGTMISLIVSTMLAYAISKTQLPGVRKVTLLLFFTLLFSGGMIPMYLTVRELGLLDSIWSLIIPGAVSTYYVLIMRNFFMQLPEGLEESAKLDGAGDSTVLLRIVMPLSVPLLATITLFYGVGYWNTFLGAIMYISDMSKYPLQLIIYNMINSSNTELTDPSILSAVSRAQPASEVLKITALIISVVPIVCVYPFLQKYFVKGVLIGAVKG